MSIHALIKIYSIQLLVPGLVLPILIFLVTLFLNAPKLSIVLALLFIPCFLVWMFWVYTKELSSTRAKGFLPEVRYSQLLAIACGLPGLLLSLGLIFLLLLVIAGASV